MAQTTTRSDLVLLLTEAGRELQGTLEYASELFEASTIARWAGHWKHLLHVMTDMSETTLGQLALLSEVERCDIVEGFNATQTPAWSTGLVHELFEAQAERTPDAVALSFEGQTLSYGELNRRANRLAHALLASGVRPDMRVGVCAERSVAMVVALLGILKAGGAYVPFDPGYPAERLAYLWRDSGPAKLLMQRGLESCMEGLVGERWLLDAGGHAPGCEECAEHNPVVPELRPDHLAYVIYTSGSTGQPKGAMNQHDGVVNRLCWAQSQYRLDGADTVLQKTPYSFDVSVWEFFLPLLSGARLVLARPGGHQQPDYLRELMEREAVTTVHFVPSMLSLFLDVAGDARLPSLRRVLCSGEALPYALQQRFARQHPQVELHNLYGPTEAAIDVTSWVCAETDPRQTVPIGRPIANTQIYVLDGHGEPVPVGVSGELYIGGAGVARGYLNRPELTAERFVADRFSGKAGARLYRTGDLARWRADGVLEFLGRNDFQVKIRGFRIELGEIEAALLACEGIREVVVLAREDVPGDKRLVAYVVGEEGATQAGVLRAQLSQRLAEYMLPSAYVRLEAMPLTTNGKLDRQGLPAPDDAAVAMQVYEAPQGEVEQALAELWQELLGLERVGRHDHFFELGGHSLLAVQLVGRMKEVFGVDVPVKEPFDHPLLHQLADVTVGLQLDVYMTNGSDDIDAELAGLSEEELRALLLEGMSE